MNILTDHPLQNYSTFGIDVKAKFFVEINSEDDINDLLHKKDFINEPKLVLGGGSNLLFIKDFDGLIFKISILGINIVEEDGDNVLIKAGAGVLWDDLVSYAIENNYGGIENLILIPGTVGAAPIQNIGAYGQELAETFHSLNGIYVESGEIKSFAKDECKFGYRDSIFKNELRNKIIITSVNLRLNKEPSAQLSYQEVISEVENQNILNPTIIDVSGIISNIRKEKLPHQNKLKNAGSFFKNPVISIKKYENIKDIYPDLKFYPVDDENVKIPAAWLIEKCQLKGKRKGSVGTHQNQPLVIVNFGGATGKEVLDFATMIKESVYEKFAISLEYEVNII
ncbi:MAG: UDP-N-acetylmuramate dehydrogenase [Ignavibacteriaceae bacterium]|nr:UDP-N-acetylmuramate dehydrogenase [Ignavibacteriaceae bacterium]